MYIILMIIIIVGDGFSYELIQDNKIIKVYEYY